MWVVGGDEDHATPSHYADLPSSITCLMCSLRCAEVRQLSPKQEAKWLMKYIYQSIYGRHMISG